MAASAYPTYVDKNDSTRYFSRCINAMLVHDEAGSNLERVMELFNYYYDSLYRQSLDLAISYSDFITLCILRNLYGNGADMEGKEKKMLANVEQFWSNSLGTELQKSVPLFRARMLMLKFALSPSYEDSFEYLYDAILCIDFGAHQSILYWPTLLSYLLLLCPYPAAASQKFRSLVIEHAVGAYARAFYWILERTSYLPNDTNA